MKAHAAAPNPWFRRDINSGLQEIDEACIALRLFLAGRDGEERTFAVELLAREALNNAVLHGGGRRVGKKVHLTLRIGRRWIRLEVHDEGKGFDWRRKQRGVAQVNALHGRGMSILKTYADRVHFNQDGNRVTMWLELKAKRKRCQNV